ncbi:hypothetical protein [Geomonas subterranea]|uniref:hypothetical protein n=1 Tax=Geomonas subterranea TaxID=2847989 RepID=UPI001CD2C206|nr:hypothetical protein [Geomonas fuzhouensis]
MSSVRGFTSTGSGTLDYVRSLLHVSRQDPELARQVTVAPLPSPVRRRIRNLVAYKACFRNAELAIRTNKGGLYVLGYWQHLIPVEHAWVRFGDVYHDPTSEILFNGKPGLFVSVVELELSQVEEIQRAIGTRDSLDLYGYFKWLGRERREAA